MTKDEQRQVRLVCEALLKNEPSMPWRGGRTDCACDVCKAARLLLAEMKHATFVQELAKNQQDLPTEFNEVIDKHFWKLGEGAEYGEDD